MTTMRSLRRFLILLFLLCAAAARSPIDSTEYQARRRAAMEKIPDGNSASIPAVFGKGYRAGNGEAAAVMGGGAKMKELEFVAISLVATLATCHDRGLL